MKHTKWLKHVPRSRRYRIRKYWQRHDIVRKNYGNNQIKPPKYLWHGTSTYGSKPRLMLPLEGYRTISIKNSPFFDNAEIKIEKIGSAKELFNKGAISWQMADKLKDKPIYSAYETIDGTIRKSGLFPAREAQEFIRKEVRELTGRTRKHKREKGNLLLDELREEMEQEQNEQLFKMLK